jgi:hypothetical protein
MEIFFPMYRESKYSKDIYYKVRWIALKRPLGYLDGKAEVRDKDLIEYIIDEQYNFGIESKYIIDNKDEKNFACEILEIYRKYIMEAHLAKSFNLKKSIYDLSFLEFYMVTLCGFLNANLLNSQRIESNKMYYPRSDYSLTNFGITYTKLYYICTVFCKQQEKTKGFTYTLPQNIKKNIDNKKIEVLKY